MIFTIIIPAYNCEKTLAATVDSVRSAGLWDYEIILVDDGSRDGTGPLCDALCRQYAEIRCIHQQNAGVSAARNRGIEEAQGEYLWFVDADDRVDAGSMTEAAGIVQAQQPDMLIFGMQFEYYHRKKCYRRDVLLPPCEGMQSSETVKTQFSTFYESNSLTSACNKLFCRSLFSENAIRFREDMHLMEDFLFVLETLPDCRSIYCLPKSIYRYAQEDETKAFRRLQRIPDLAEYVAPFQRALEAVAPEAAQIFPGFYRMLLHQKLYYASLPELRRTLAVHHKGRYSAICDKTDPVRIYLKNCKSRLRHKLAVAVKSTAVYQKIRERG